MDPSQTIPGVVQSEREKYKELEEQVMNLAYLQSVSERLIEVLEHNLMGLTKELWILKESIGKTKNPRQRLFRWGDPKPQEEKLVEEWNTYDNDSPVDQVEAIREAVVISKEQPRPRLYHDSL